jgi:hypothetical protein
MPISNLIREYCPRKGRLIVAVEPHHKPNGGHDQAAPAEVCLIKHANAFAYRIVPNPVEP